MDQVTEILIDAHKILSEEVEWCQNTLVMEERVNGNKVIISACALGALDMAAARAFNLAFDDRYGHEVQTAINEGESRLAAAINGPVKHVADFNDAPETSKEDVLLLFKHAIELGE